MIVDILPGAFDDLDRISAYIERETNRAVADGYDARIRAKIATLANFPNRGTERPEFGKGVRSVIFEGRILLLYRVDGECVQVTRVLSARRNLSDLTF